MIETTLEGRFRRGSGQWPVVCRHKIGQPLSSDFAAVLAALTSGPRTTAELETITGSAADIVREVLQSPDADRAYRAPERLVHAATVDSVT